MKLPREPHNEDAQARDWSEVPEANSAFSPGFSGYLLPLPSKPDEVPKAERGLRDHCCSGF